jgi:16S rRNA (guanine527-N7)-methyltransferase
VNFADELNAVLPPDLPNRAHVVTKAAVHLERIVEANASFNLTRITSVREAVIKHVLDSVLPWRFFADAPAVLDAGTGAGFPGVPLALVLPGVRFVLSESVGKKARFVEATIEDLGLGNADVRAVRAEELLATCVPNTILTGRAVAPVIKAAELFGPELARVKGARAIFYKGPSVMEELAEAAPVLNRNRLRGTVLQSYDLPDGLGSRSMLELRVRQ